MHFPPKKKRHYLESKFNATSAQDTAKLIQTLKEKSPQDFNQAKEWFGLFHEASLALSEAQTLLELKVNLDTLDKQAEKNLREFEEKVLVQLLSARQELMEIYLESPWRLAMHADDRERISRDFHGRKKYSSSSPRLAALQIEEAQIAREYRAFNATSKTYFHGEEVPVSLIIGKQNSTSQATRKEAFFAYWKFISENEHILQGYFDRLLNNRREQAKLVQAPSYVDLAFAELGRTDYSALDCALFRDGILQTILPQLLELLPAQLQSIAETKLSPWNTSFWPQLAPEELPAHGNLFGLTKGMEKIVANIHPSFGKLFSSMLEQGFIDIIPRSGKAPGAFSVTFHESNMPFLFGNFAGNFKDAFTFLHEFGHSIHGFAITQIDNILLRTPGYEFCEVASQGLELLASPFFHIWWPKEKDAQKALAFQLFQMLSFWPFMAMIDEWQHIVYSAKTFVAAEERNKIWQELSQKYRPFINWEECPAFEKLGWFSRPHLFTSPFYFIDYGIAQLGAVQLWQQSKQDYNLAIKNYIAALSLGAQRSLPELFQAAHLEFQFSSHLLDTLGRAMSAEIKRALQES